MKIRRDDTVLVIAGKDRGKTGKVRQSFPKEGRVIVDGVNIVKRHMKPRGNVRQAGIIESESPIRVSNVMLICTKCNNPARIEFRLLEGGTKARVCSRCGEVID
jgi:large subunit ribosomal protein L24